MIFSRGDMIFSRGDMIFSRGHFDDYSINESNIQKSINESMDILFFLQTDSITVFLSHKHSDLEDLKGIIGLLQKYGVKPYIDSRDNRMPSITSGETANIIRKSIKKCNKFIFLATNDAIESYWCNWELGFGDVHKYKKNIAILPMKEKNASDKEYKGNEYLQIYPYIIYKMNSNICSDGYYVRDPFKNANGKYSITPLKLWLEK
ncbi:MAG: toll/interleukin-1 receptor domain-containing protein [Candidatus Cloacimonadales bacterium]